MAGVQSRQVWWAWLVLAGVIVFLLGVWAGGEIRSPGETWTIGPKGKDCHVLYHHPQRPSWPPPGWGHPERTQQQRDIHEVRG